MMEDVLLDTTLMAADKQSSEATGLPASSFHATAAAAAAPAHRIRAAPPSVMDATGTDTLPEDARTASVALSLNKAHQTNDAETVSSSAPSAISNSSPSTGSEHQVAIAATTLVGSTMSSEDESVRLSNGSRMKETEKSRMSACFSDTQLVAETSQAPHDKVADNAEKCHNNTTLLEEKCSQGRLILSSAHESQSLAIVATDESYQADCGIAPDASRAVPHGGVAADPMDNGTSLPPSLPFFSAAANAPTSEEAQPAKSPNAAAAFLTSSHSAIQPAAPPQQQQQQQQLPAAARRTRSRPTLGSASPMFSKLACKSYRPTLAELQSMSFSDYVRYEVLAGAMLYVQDSDDADDGDNTFSYLTQPPILWTQGIAKVRLPDGFWAEATIGKDRTGRGPAWQASTTSSTTTQLAAETADGNAMTAIGFMPDREKMNEELYPSPPVNAPASYGMETTAWYAPPCSIVAAASDAARSLGNTETCSQSPSKSVATPNGMLSLPDTESGEQVSPSPVVAQAAADLDPTLGDKKMNVEAPSAPAVVRALAEVSGPTLGDMVIHSPMKQHVRGIGGVYELAFTDEPPVTLAKFRDVADQYREQQVGCATEREWSEERIAVLERLFWKRIGPTMPPAMYGADQEGTLFGDDKASGWSLGQLDSCLHVLHKVPGVTTPYIYAGMWGSVFCAHSEDMNLLSINYLHAGAPKIWYAVAPGQHAARFEALCGFHFSLEEKRCKQFLRHKRSLLSPQILQKAGIPYQMAVQMPGDAIITFPGGYHFGFNAGFNMAEATNFGVPEWIPYGLKAKICMCRPDSVRIDMERLVSMLALFEKDQARRPRLTWKTWSQRREQRRRRKEQKEVENDAAEVLANLASPVAVDTFGRPLAARSDQERKHEFWIEVMKPVPKAKVSIAELAPVADALAEKSIPHEAPEEEDLGQGRRKRKRKLHFDEQYKDEPIKRPKRKVEPQRQRFFSEDYSRTEVWHLARQIGKKKVAVGLRILCLVPAEVMGSTRQLETSGKDDDDEDEQCFAGHVTEVLDDHVRIRFDGLSKAEDMWVALDSPKLLLDCGRWTDDTAKAAILPKLHFWKEVDSKRKCKS